jgi:uncharacterized protein (DUF58 family)
MLRRRSLRAALRERLAGRLQRWLDRRVRPARRQVLHRRNLFIFPTGQGFAFAALCGLLLITAINYQNSLTYFLAFLLGSLFVVAIVETFRNLAGVTVEGVRAEPAFAGDDAVFHLRLSAPRRRSALVVGFPARERLHLDLEGGSPVPLRVACVAPARGRFRPGRVLVETRHPLTLLRCWAWLDVDLAAVVYPRPLLAPLPVTAGRDEERNAVVVDAAGREFHGLREYRAGDAQRHVAWRRFASTGVLAVKQFARGGSSGGPLWLRYEAAGGAGREQRLSRMAGWVVQAARDDVEYGLELPGLVVPPQRGEQHRLRCLEALALFDAGSDP